MNRTNPEAISPEAILIVDDDPSMRRVISRMLDQHGFRWLAAPSAAEARRCLDSESVDLLICDVQMPEESGLDLIATVRESDPQVGILMVSADDDPDTVELAGERGAGGYLLKPFDERQLLIEIGNAIKRRDEEGRTTAHREQLEESLATRNFELVAMNSELQEKNRELKRLRYEMINRLARAVDARDSDTGGHIERMGRLSAAIGDWIGLDAERRETVMLAAAMHDVGKLGVPDSILCKPGALTEAERGEMQQHARIGHGILAGSGLELLDLAAAIALTHHEHWDGNGYPLGLSGEEIPIEGRIAALADVLDALLNDRVYRPAFSLPETLVMIQDGRGSHFDPAIVDALFAHMDEVKEILGVGERDRSTEASGNGLADVNVNHSADAPWPEPDVALRRG